MSNPIAGLRILVLEDEFLIAMDVEQLCSDTGAAAVSIVGSIEDLPNLDADALPFDVAIIDLVLAGESTLGFATQLKRRGVPFIFASGHSHNASIQSEFPDVELVTKPYSGDDLIDAVVRSVAKSALAGRMSGS